MIRAATVADAETLVTMGEAFHEEAGYAAVFPFDKVSFGITLALLGQRGLLLAAEGGGEVVGMAGIDVAPAIANHAVGLAREVFWYVRPSHRKGIGRELLAGLETLARAHGILYFDVVAEEGPGMRSEGLARLYRGSGFSPAERTFRKRLEPLRCQSDPSLAA